MRRRRTTGVNRGLHALLPRRGREHITLAKYRSLDGPIEHDTILEERDQALAADGVWGEVVHSNLAFNGYSADNDLAFAHARVYNDYVVEVFGEHFDRHKPTAMLPLTDVADAVAEIERLAGLGIQAVMPPMSAPQRYCTTAYDPVWAAAQANGMVVFFHVGAGMAMDDESLARSTKGVALRESGIDMDLEIQTGPVHANRLRATIPATLDAQYLLADLVGGGILEHFPDLHFVITEFNAFWLAGLMASLDKAYTLGIGQDISAPTRRRDLRPQPGRRRPTPGPPPVPPQRQVAVPSPPERLSPPPGPLHLPGRSYGAGSATLHRDRLPALGVGLPAPRGHLATHTRGRRGPVRRHTDRRSGGDHRWGPCRNSSASARLPADNQQIREAAGGPRTRLTPGWWAMGVRAAAAR